MTKPHDDVWDTEDGQEAKAFVRRMVGEMKQLRPPVQELVRKAFGKVVMFETMLGLFGVDIPGSKPKEADDGQP